MAVIFYVKDGPRPNNSGRRREVPVADLEARLAGRRVKYLSAQPPQINPATPSQYPNYVVIAGRGRAARISKWIAAIPNLTDSADRFNAALRAAARSR